LEIRRQKRTFAFSSRSRRPDSATGEDSDRDRKSPSRSKSHKKSSKSTRSPKRRSR